ncbi:MAG TPA: diguanylate cyclase [Terriglobia bacterium]|nr:diguanylate cyclase [Terriglobia bacterium]
MRILIAEDEPVSRRLLEVMLQKWNFEVDIATNGAEAWKILQGEDAPRIAILDWMMPEMDGLQVCQKIRELRAEPYTYVILLTARGLKEDVVEGIEAGADDYLSKPFDSGELKARLRSGIRILELQESLIASRDALRFQATHDNLTGLWNRGATLDALRRELSRADRQGAPVAVIMADLDHFKQINDTFGHLVGDEVLREAASRLGSGVRLYDWVGRYGGEEFMVILPECEVADAVKQAERLRAAISSKPFESSGGLIPVTLSLGVAGGLNTNIEDTTTWVRAADEALYRAKEKGRNRVEQAMELHACVAA